MDADCGLGDTRVGEEKNTETRIGTESMVGDTRIGQEKNTEMRIGTESVLGDTMVGLESVRRLGETCA